MDENQTNGTFSDSIIKYCVDKFVEFFAKHWLKVLILIALLAMENNRRFLGFAVDYATGKLVVQENDIAVLLDVVPILAVTYLAYRTNLRMNQINSEYILYMQKKSNEKEEMDKIIFRNNLIIIRIEYFKNLKKLIDETKELKRNLKCLKVLTMMNTDNNLEKNLPEIFVKSLDFNKYILFDEIQRCEDNIQKQIEAYSNSDMKISMSLSWINFKSKLEIFKKNINLYYPIISEYIRINKNGEGFDCENSETIVLISKLNRFISVCNDIIKDLENEIKEMKVSN